MTHRHLTWLKTAYPRKWAALLHKEADGSASTLGVPEHCKLSAFNQRGQSLGFSHNMHLRPWCSCGHSLCQGHPSGHANAVRADNPTMPAFSMDPERKQCQTPGINYRHFQPQAQGHKLPGERGPSRLASPSDPLPPNLGPDSTTRPCKELPLEGARGAEVIDAEEATCLNWRRASCA